MSSCTNNSIISGILVASSDASNGKRLAFKQDTSKNWDSTVAAGDVIRYDVATGKFTQSIANPNYGGTLNLSQAEVVGVVESISQTSGVTYATVVTHGLMNYPNLLAIISGISGSAGGAGGTDIFFLSPTVLGGITFEFMEETGYIVKPVLQVCPTSDELYNSVVVNYIGYESSAAENYTVRTSSSNIGAIQTVDSDSPVPDGWVDTSTPQVLSIATYSESYDIYGTDYGSYEQLTINGSYSFVSALSQQSIRPINPTTGKGIGSFAFIRSVDTSNNTIVLDHITPQEELWNSNYTTYELQTPVLGLNRVAVTSGQITHFKTPKLSTNIEASAGTSNQVSAFSTKTLLRVKPDTTVSYLPDSAIFNSIEVSDTLSTPNVADVDAKLVALEARIQTLEQILGI
jgi:hypothetical protein